MRAQGAAPELAARGTAISTGKTGTRRAPCPKCNKGPRDTALSITTDERGTVCYCFRCGYVATEAFERRPGSRPGAPPTAQPLEWSDRAEYIWRSAVPIFGTAAETYLRHRGCVLPPADSDLRFLTPTAKHPPTLCARVSDIRTAKPISLHFTKLAADGRGKAGSDRDKLLMGGHRKKDGCIRLWPDEAVTHGLAIAEGIESALAAAHAYTPVWAAIDAGNLRAFPLVHGIDALTIFADHDDTGLTAASECARRWLAAGADVAVLRARQAGRDAADVALRLQGEA